MLFSHVRTHKEVIMKGMKRTLALVLSAAVAVTSISVNWEMTSYAAAPEAGAETGDAASKAASLISWQTEIGRAHV